MVNIPKRKAYNDWMKEVRGLVGPTTRGKGEEFCSGKAEPTRWNSEENKVRI